MVTARRILVPLPLAPIKSAPTLNNPSVAPPNAAAVGMTLFNSLYILTSFPLVAITIC